MNWRNGIGMFVLLVLSGCAASPGMHLDESRYPVKGGVTEKGEKLPDIHITPIDADLLAQEILKQPMPRSNEPLLKELAAYQ